LLSGLPIYFLLILVTSNIYSQNITGFEKISSQNQCDLSISFGIVQDRYKNTWIASEEGLLRYNARNMKLFDEYHGLPSGFSNKIENLIIDEKLGMWISSGIHLAKFNRETNVFEEVKLHSKESHLIYDMCFYNNKLWIATFNGLFTIMPGQNKDAEKVKGFETLVQHLNVVGRDLLIASNQGTYVIHDGNTASFKISNENIRTASEGYKQNTIIAGTESGHCLMFDVSWNLKTELAKFSYPITDIVKGELSYFIATDGSGFLEYSPDFNLKKHYKSDGRTSESLPVNGVYDLMLDSDQSLWICMYGGGVMRSTDKKSYFITENVNTTGQGLQSNYIKAIKKTSDGNLWVGTKKSISILTKNGNWKNLPNLNSNAKEDIVLCFAENRDYVTAGTFGNGVYKIRKQDFHSTPVTSAKYQEAMSKVNSILIDKEGNYWFGTLKGLLRFKSDEDAMMYNTGPVKHVIAHADGTIYTAGRNGIFKIENNKAVKLNYLLDGNKFNYYTVNQLYFTIDGGILIGTVGDGLIYYEKDNRKYHIFDFSNGFPSDNIQGISGDQDQIWVSTSRGLVRMKSRISEDKSYYIYDENDGLNNSNFNYGAIDYNNHEIFLGTSDGLVHFDDKTLSEPSSKIPLYIESIEWQSKNNEKSTLIVDTEQAQQAVYHLPYNHSQARISFIGIDYNVSQQIKYSWFLEGYSHAWSKPDLRTYAELGRLKPGTYQFRIKYLHHNVPGSETKAITLKIASPWWASWWAIIGYILLTIAIVYFLLKFLYLRMKKRNIEDQVSFYNNITHEIKTPLSILLTKLEKLKTTDGTDDIKVTVSRINTLFDQLLNFEKYNSAFYRDQPVSLLNIDDQYQLLIRTFKHLIAEKRINVNYINHVLDNKFYYKKDIFEKINYNLISNAIKYTKENGIIDILVNRDKNHLLVEVKDNGIGIPKDQQKVLLRKYYRARNAVNSQIPGTGLGLMMVKNLLDIDGGDISFISEEGLGTSFKVVFPDLKYKYGIEGKEENEFTQKENLTTPEIISGLPTVLIAEDNDELRIEMVERLSGHFRILPARTGVEALEKAKLHKPELIITDIIMPEMDGIELCKVLNTEENTQHIPVFMMTVLGDSSHKVESVNLGVHSYFQKPLDYPFLIAKILKTLEERRNIKQDLLHELDVEKSNKFKNERDAEFISKIEQYIISNAHEEDISVTELSRHLGMSRTGLYMKVMEILKMSPKNLIVSVKLEYARKLLVEGGNNIQQISYMVGFNNPKYFSTAYKKHFGISPSQYLKSIYPDSNEE
jgi:signal transduction histidine kinase/ligand-binding sensor domain-containing protein/AraC-like DNA-binding protein